MTPTKPENVARHVVRNEVFETLKAHGGKKLRWGLFGSSKSGIFTADADIDIRGYLHGSAYSILPPSQAAKAKVVGFLNIVGGRLAKLGGKSGFANVTGRHSRYPLLDMRHHRSCISVQIVSANSSHRSTASVVRFRDQLKSLDPLYSVLRTMLKVRGLTDVFHGGLSSYPLVNMIAASLLLRPGRNLGEDLVNFLRLYSTLDTRAKAISLTPPGIHDRRSPPADGSGADGDGATALADLAETSRREGLGFMLCLQDPADPANDLGRKTFAWRHVAATMGHACRRLERLVRLHDRPGLPAKRGRGGAAPAFLLGELVGPCARMYAWRRRAARRFGRSLVPRARAAPVVGAGRRERGMARLAARRWRLGTQRRWMGKKRVSARRTA